MEKEGGKARKGVLTKDGVSQAYHLMEYYLRLGVFANAVPFTYDRKIRRFGLDRKGLKYKIWIIFTLLAMAGETVQVLLELWRGEFDETVSRGEWCLILFITFSWTFILSCHYFTMTKGDMMVNYINQCLRMRDYFTEERLPYTSEHVVVRSHLSCTVLQCFFQCMMVAGEGYMGKKQYIFSNVPEHYRNLTTGLIWAAYAYWRVITNFMTGYFYIFSAIFHVMTCNQVLEYRMTVKQSFHTNLKTYRMLQLLCNRFNETYSNSWIPSVTVVIVTNIILGNFGTLRFADNMAFDKYMNFPLMAVLMMVLTFTLFPKMATVKETSQYEKIRMLSMGAKMNELILLEIGRQKKAEALLDLDMEMSKSHATTRQSQPTRVKSGASQRLAGSSKSMSVTSSKLLNENQIAHLKEVTCCARSCPEISLQMGSFYSIKSSTVLNIYDFVVCNTISALLTV